MPRILFLSEACLLDRKSGAAQSVRAMLHALAAAGWEARAVTLNLCDGDRESPLALGQPALDPARHGGERVTVVDGALSHQLLVARSTRHAALRPWELRAFHVLAQEVLAQWRPDVVLTYCAAPSHPLLAQARRLGARTVFYLANAAYAHKEEAVLPAVDEVLVPSQAMADLYRERRGIETRVLGGGIVARPFDGRRNLAPARVAARRERWVTLVNPDPAKGGLFFINLAAQMAALAPGLRFRAVESRWGRADWAARGVAAADLDRIDWHPATDDMARVYDEAALLLVPSLGFEASGRVVAEALLAGVPVLAMRTGGIPEQLGDGGFLFDLPEALARNPLAAPEPAHMQPWLDHLRVLMSSDALYARAVDLALRAAAAHEPARRAAEVVAVFGSLLTRPALSGMADTADAQEALAAQRARMNAEREAINARVEAGGASGMGDSGAPGDTPYLPLLQRSLAQPAIRDALAAVNGKDWPRARAILEPYLRLLPEDITALGLLGEAADGEEHEAEARELLERVVRLAPGFVQGQQRLVDLLRRTGEAQAALAHSFALIERAPHQPRYLALHAALLAAVHRYEEAIAVYGAFFRQRPGDVHDWMQYGHALRTLGRRDEAIDAFRMAIGLAPGHGAAWHALSNLKLAVFTDEDVARMQAEIARAELADEQRSELHFALGKAHEDHQRYAASFEHYASANRIRRVRSDYDVGRIEDYVAQAKAAFTVEFFAQRAGQGDPARDPVFVLGLHRAGSTLVEQILASHSAIEGTHELLHLPHIGRDFGGIGPRGQGRGLNAALLADLGGDEWARLGRQYLGLSAADRRTARPMFVDKMPANWMYTGLIHLMLPNARIVDIRRAPMAAGFALFKMNFGRGVGHAFDQKDIARYYRAYADLMAHFDAVLPGRVHHIRYESLVAHTEAEIRRLVDYCGLPFEEGCLRYWETERAIQTPSSEQVRQPIYRSAVEQWRHYEPWLGPMKDAFRALAQEKAPEVAAEATDG